MARELCRAVEAWAVELGCREFASDAAITDPGAQEAHRGLGFEETERVVCYRKTIAGDSRSTDLADVAPLRGEFQDDEPSDDG